MLSLKEPVETRDQHGASKVAVVGDEAGVTGGRGQPGLITSVMERGYTHKDYLEATQ